MWARQAVAWRAHILVEGLSLTLLIGTAIRSQDHMLPLQFCLAFCCITNIDDLAKADEIRRRQNMRVLQLSTLLFDLFSF